MPRGLKYALLIGFVLSLVPFALIARARASKSGVPRLHVVFDMDNQPKRKAQSEELLFADHRAMRPQVAGTIARGDLKYPEAVEFGRTADGWVEKIPIPVTDAMMKRGQERFNIYCSVCHGLDGYGDGMVSQRALQLGGGWIKPTSYHTDTVRERPDGHIFNTITNGIRTMPAYGSQIPVEDRWAIVAYVRALQRSQNATLRDVPVDMRANLTTAPAQ